MIFVLGVVLFLLAHCSQGNVFMNLTRKEYSGARFDSAVTFLPKNGDKSVEWTIDSSNN